MISAKKTVLAVALASINSLASASSFYIDNGIDFTGGDSGQVTTTSTSMKNQLTYQYESTSFVTDANNNGFVDAGEAISTAGGMAVAGNTLGNNNVTGFTPDEVFGTNSNNGYGSSWFLSFGFSGLTGTVVDPFSLDIAYGPGGVFSLYYLTSALDPLDASTNFMNINITGAVTTGTGLLLQGLVDFTGVTTSDTLKNLFHSGDQSCAGDTSFFAITTTCGSSMYVEFLADFNTNAATVTRTVVDANTIQLTGSHDGSAVFNANSIPEPTTLALMSVALISFGVRSRRNQV